MRDNSVTDRWDQVLYSARRFKREALVPASATLSYGLLLLALLAPLHANAQSGPVTGFSFLKLEPSARAAALGGSFGAVYGDDVNGLFYNPALLNPAMHNGVSISYLNYLSDVNAGFLAYSRSYEGTGSLGVGLRFLTWGDIQGADEHGTPTETFGAGDVALTAGIARSTDERFRYGGSLHLVYSRIESYRASALAADVGVAYHIPEAQFTASASVNNLGRSLSSLGTERDELPMDVRIGVAKRLQHVPLLLSLTAYNLNRPNDVADGVGGLSRALHFITIGGEFQFSPAFNVRFGYNHRRHEALKAQNRLDTAGTSAGFGIKVARINVDYAFSSWSSAGGLHQFTVRTKL